jgi:hypothetical protein
MKEKSSMKRWPAMRFATVAAIAAVVASSGIAAHAAPPTTSPIAQNARPTAAAHPRGVQPAGLTFVGNFRISSLWSGGDLENASWGVGQDTVLAPQGNTNAQWWSFYSKGGSWYEVVNYSTGLCLDADTNTINRDGTKVQTWYCNGSAQQTWDFGRLDLNVRQQIVNELALDDAIAHLGTCHCYLDEDISNPYSWHRAQLWQNVGGSNQYWFLNQN